MNGIARKTFIGIPSHNGQVYGDIINSILDAAIAGEPIVFRHQPFSLLARNFNDLLSMAINRGDCTHFLLLHADMIPTPGWLGKLHEVMEEKKCDVLSVVAPIKSNKAETSTALRLSFDNEQFRARRLSMKEIAEMPETFEHNNLLVNSGCLLLDLRAPWIGKAWFEIKDEVIVKPDGKYKAVGISEDWLFSMRARAAGAKIFATRAVKVFHVGTHAFTNDPKDWL